MGGRVGGVDAEGAESEWEKLRGLSQRGRSPGGRLTPLTIGRIYRHSFEKCLYKFGHRTVNFNHMGIGLPWQWMGMLELEMLPLEPCRYSLEHYTLSLEPWRFTLEHEKLSLEPGGSI